MQTQYIFLCIIFLFQNFLAIAQPKEMLEELTLEQAISKAVNNNHEVKIQRQNIYLTQNKIIKANAGKRPTIDAVGLASYTNNIWGEVELRTFQPEPPKITIDDTSIETMTVSIGVEAEYLLWDAKRSHYRFQLLEGLSEIEKAKQQVIINGIIEGVSDLFFEIIKLQNQENLLLESIAVTKTRIQKIEDKIEFGRANKLTRLQAETALNQDQSTLDNIDLIKSNLLLDLKFLMNEINENTYFLSNKNTDLGIPSQAEILPKILAKNPELALLDKGILLADLDLSLSKTASRPIIASFANAGYFWQKNDIQQLSKVQNVGITIGISAKYNLYDGGINDNKIQQANIAKEIEILKRKQVEDKLSNAAKKELTKMNLVLSQLNREENNLVVYQENYDKVNERYLLGKLPAITLREAQLALTNSKLISANLKIDFQKSKVKLKQLMGDFVE